MYFLLYLVVTDPSSLLIKVENCCSCPRHAGLPNHSSKKRKMKISKRGRGAGNTSRCIKITRESKCHHPIPFLWLSNDISLLNPKSILARATLTKKFGVSFHP